MAGDIVGAVMTVATLCGFGLLVYRHGLVGAWNGLKGTLHDLFNVRLSVPVPALAQALMHGRPAPVCPTVREKINLAQLEAAAAVPMAELIAAAERRATHPDEPEPKVLADLDPANWQIPKPVLPHVVLPPPTEEEKAQIEAQFRAATSVEKKATVLAPTGFTYVQITPDPAPFPGRVRDQVQPERPKGFYDDCDHPSAIHERITTAASSYPIRTMVKSCVQCEDKHRAGQIAAEIKALLVAATSDSERGIFSLTQEQAARYRLLAREADRIKTRRYAAVEMAHLERAQLVNQPPPA